MKKRTMPFLLAAALLATPAVALAQEGELPQHKKADQPVNADTELLDAWWAVCRMVRQDKPWPECRDWLAEAAIEYAASKHAGDCLRLVEGLELASEQPSSPATFDESSSVEDLVAGLSEARLGYVAVLMPYYYHTELRRFEWDVLASDAAGDPALLLYLKGRAALPALVEALGDRRATRTVVSEEERFRYPQVYLVSDLAVALIEAISGCSFRESTGQRAMVSGWPVDKQEDQFEAIRAWWSATREMAPADSALWHLRRANSFARDNTVRSMLHRGWGDAALAYLTEHFRNGSTVNYQLATLTLEAGSRLPLDLAHEQVAAGSALDSTMVRLIGASGEAVDFQLLADVVAATCTNNDRPTSRQLHMIVHELTGHDDRTTIPVMVAVIERELKLIDQGAGVGELESQGYLRYAAQHIQELSGVNFGYDPQAREARRLRAYRDIVEWWRREGCGAYGFAQTKPLAPGGIR